MSGVLIHLGAASPALPATVSTALSVAPVQSPQPPPGQGAEFGKASPIALVVIVLLALATILLIRSMSKRIRRLPASFDAPGRSGRPPADDPPTGTAGPATPVESDGGPKG